MRFRLAAAWTLVAGVGSVVGQQCSSSMTQVNETICTWQGVRGRFAVSPISFTRLTGIANIVRDTIYMDGGQIWLQQYVINEDRR